jgi:hypothetical protein
MRNGHVRPLQQLLEPRANTSLAASSKVSSISDSADHLNTADSVQWVLCEVVRRRQRESPSKS